VSVYRAATSLDAVALADGGVLLRSDTASCRLEGPSAKVFVDHILPTLRRWTGLDAIMPLLTGYAEDDVITLLDRLNSAGVLHKRSLVPAESESAARTLAELGIDEDGCTRRLSKLRVGLFGLDAVGCLITESLVKAGVGTVLLADPARQTDAADNTTLRAGTSIRLAPRELSRSAVEDLAAELDLMVVTFDRSFLVARHWVNRAALATGCPALFVDVSLAEAIIGPTVLAGETGCYMCFRMRHLATSDNFTEVMAHEQFLDAKRDPTGTRPLFPGLAEIAAGMATGEAIRLLFGPLVPALTNAVMVVKPVEALVERHHVLRQPDCPHCRGIDTAVRIGG
jgi:bacteriocin biosynthesis cyclodehydratase domain-containing protein